MSVRTVTGTVESDASPDSVVEFLADPRNIPQWAPAFADKVESDAREGWEITKNGSSFSLQVSVQRPSRTVDYLREVAPGIRGGAYLRVLPRPGGGSVIVLTLPVPAGSDRSAVATVLNQELEALAALMS